MAIDENRLKKIFDALTEAGTDLSYLTLLQLWQASRKSMTRPFLLHDRY